MIARPSAGAHVCLRCRLRLSKQFVPSRAQKALSSTTSPSWALPIEESSQDHAATRTKATRSTLNRNTITHRPLQNRSDAIPRLHGYRAHGQQLVEGRESLNVESLGKPAEVIVLRDSKIHVYDHRKKLEPGETESIDILEAVKNERGLVGQNEVDGNINEFRPPAGEEPQTWEKLDQLVLQLQNGFTTTQLASYIESHHLQGADDPQGPTAPSNVEARILRVSPWMPNISGSTDSFDESSIRGYYWTSHTSKQRLVLRLIRECWGVELPELAEGIGEVEVQIRNEDMDVLFKGVIPPLQAISERHLENGEKLEAFRSRGVLRITSTRLKSERVIEKIEQALNHIRRLNVSLAVLMPSAKSNPSQVNAWLARNFDNTVVAELSKLTNTIIKRYGKRALLITCVDMKPDAETSNRSDVARRLLMTSGTLTNRVRQMIGHRAPEGQVAGFVEYPDPEGLSWRDRLRQWSRWSIALPKESGDERASIDGAVFPQNQKDDSPPSATTRPLATAIQVEQGKQYEDVEENVLVATNIHWEDGTTNESSALMGALLHSDQAVNNPLNVRSHFGLHKDSKYAFSASAPNISRFLGTQTLVRERPVESLVIQLQPNPWHQPMKGASRRPRLSSSQFPSVEMRLSVDRKTDDLKLEDVRAIVRMDNSDLMLPHYAVDIRFQQKVMASFKKLDHPEITKFLEASTLKLNTSQALETPPKLTLPVAKHLCSPQVEVEDDSDCVNVEYLFAGLEYRQTVVLNFGRWRMHYTSIEAGKAAGRRSELRLIPAGSSTRMSRASKLENQKQRKLGKNATRDFVRTAFRLAEAVGTGGADGIARRVKVMRDEPVTRLVAAAPMLDLERPQSAFRYFAQRPNLSSNAEEDEEEEELAAEGGEKQQEVDLESEEFEDAMQEHEWSDQGGR